MNKSTKNILKIFEEISKIPRCSKHEEKIIYWIENWTKKYNLNLKKDKTGNILITVPASAGYENAPTVILQGHMDMVCEKIDKWDHNFNMDGIKLIYEQNWIKAENTTLGADNGIFLAIALEIAKDQTIDHPPLELLFTVDEETSMVGANKLEPDFISGKILLNLDSEDDGKFIIGCAGGITTKLEVPIKRSSIENKVTYILSAKNMTGGHSGVNIYENRANANKIIAHILDEIIDINVSLININGGNAHNAIPRTSNSIIAFLPEYYSQIENTIEKTKNILQKKYHTTDPHMDITLKKIDHNNTTIIDNYIAKNIIQLLLDLPHGVQSRSSTMPNIVETSSNLAKIETEDKTIIITISQRSSNIKGLQNINEKIRVIANSTGAITQNIDSYPSWEPDINSFLLKKCIKVYNEIFKKQPTIEVIHAGLECAVIGSKFKNIDMISFGPTIQNPHSPDERLYIPSVENIWNFLIALLKDCKYFNN